MTLDGVSVGGGILLVGAILLPAVVLETEAVGYGGSDSKMILRINTPPAPPSPRAPLVGSSARDAPAAAARWAVSW